MQAVLQDGLALRDRCNAGDISRTRSGDRPAADSPPGYGRLIDYVRRRWHDAERFAKHLANEFPAVFLFLCDPSIEATNWRAEAGHPATRWSLARSCGGNRTRKGADTQQVLASIVRTCPPTPPRQLPDLIATMLCAKVRQWLAARCHASICTSHPPTRPG